MIIQTKGKLAAIGLDSPRLAGRLRKEGIPVKRNANGFVTRIGTSIFLRDTLLEKAMGIKAKSDMAKAINDYNLEELIMDDVQAKLDAVQSRFEGTEPIDDREMKKLGAAVKACSGMLAIIEEAASESGRTGAAAMRLNDLKNHIDYIGDLAAHHEGSF